MSGHPATTCAIPAENRGVDHRWWERGDVRPALAEHFTVHAVDRRGRGQSGDAEEYALEREAEDVAAVVDAIDEPANLPGQEVPFERVLPEIAGLIDAGENEQALLLLPREIAGLSPAQIDASRSEPDWQDRVDAAHTISREGAAAPRTGVADDYIRTRRLDEQPRKGTPDLLC